MLRNKKVSLLPYIREDISGISPGMAQITGWEIKKFDIEKQWKFTKGKNVKVAVIDTGCDLDHPDLKDNLLPGKNIIDPKKDPIDKHGHGTHVSGTIAARNNSLGIVGVAPETKIIPVKALNDDGSGDLRSIIKGIEWSIEQNADFITMSLGTEFPNKELENILKYAESKKCIVFCAAGNSGENHDIMYPAKYPCTISIGSIDENLERTSFTCSGEDLDFLAPGHNILSCVPGGYAMMSGTSMSNPFAVGCAALLLSHIRQEKFSARESMLNTCLDYINIFKTKAKSLKDPLYSGKRKYEGYGIIYPVL